jgi:hypothetical protein
LYSSSDVRSRVGNNKNTGHYQVEEVLQSSPPVIWRICGHWYYQVEEVHVVQSSPPVIWKICGHRYYQLEEVVQGSPPVIWRI